MWLTFSCSEKSIEKKETPIIANKISFTEFEDITENHPEKYITNPDSFLSIIQIPPKNDEEKEIYAYGLTFMAYSLREYGHYVKSVQYYEKAINFVRKNDIDIDEELYILKPLATLYINLDDNKKAITLLEELYSKADINKSEHYIGIANNLANAYLYNQNLTKAEHFIENIIPKVVKSPTAALVYNTASKIYESQNKLDKAEYFNKLAIQNFEKQKLSGDTLIWYSAALVQNAEISQNLKYAINALDILESNFPKSQFRNKASASLSIANIYFNRSEVKEALIYYKKSFNYFTTDSAKYVLDYKFTQTLAGLAKCYLTSERTQEAVTYYQWAIENDFRTQQLITSKEDQLRNNEWNKTILEEFIHIFGDNKLLHQDNNIESLLWCIELSKARLLINEINRSEQWSKGDEDVKIGIQRIRNLQQKYDVTENEIAKQNLQLQIDDLKKDFQLEEGYFESINFNPNIENFIKRIRNSEASYYSYYIHKDSTISILNTANGKINYTHIKDKNIVEEIANFKNSYFASSPNNFNNNPEEYYANANKIFNYLLPHYSDKQPNIFISLDGPLYGLPFDALYNDGFLIQKSNFAYLNSFLLFDFIKINTNEKGSKISILYRSEFPKPLPNLEFVNKEVESLHKNYNAAKIAPNQQNDSTIRNSFSQTDIIHIAAHTILDTIAAPYLYLHQPISTDQLRYYEMKTPLVFLSACNTGSGKPLPSEGTESIQRVFMSKNVPSVISTYWFANDENMLNLTSKFYIELKENTNPMMALANAKRKFLNEASIQQHNPWYWANINYTGIANKVGLKKSSNLQVVMTGLVIVCVIIYLFKRRFRL